MKQQRIGWRYGAKLTLAAALLGAAAPGIAQVQRSGGGEAQKFMQQYQQLAGEKTALQGQLAQMKKDLDAANAELAAVKKERDLAKAHTGVSPAALAEASRAKATAEQTLEKYKEQTKELVNRYRELATTLRDVETDRNKLRDDLARRNAAFDTCADNNQQLYDINNQILDRYDHVGLFTKVSAAEPFTRLTRTRMDNLVVETRERAQELRVKKAAAANH
jgi:chromosome segregation ATPase